MNVVDLDQAVARLAADISDHEVDEEQQRRKKDAATLSFSGLHWVKREMAITRLYVAFCNGSLIAVVRDPVSGALFRLISTDWKEVLALVIRRRPLMNARATNKHRDSTQ